MDNDRKHEYNRTLKELQGYAAQECESPKLFKSLFSGYPQSPSITAPVAPSDMSTNEISKAMYIDDLKEHNKTDQRRRSETNSVYHRAL